jgi:hypothetical protein
VSQEIFVGFLHEQEQQLSKYGVQVVQVLVCAVVVTDSPAILVHIQEEQFQ